MTAQQRAQRKYRSSPKGKAAARRYAESAKGREVNRKCNRRYKESEHGKEAQRNYRMSEAGREKRRKYLKLHPERVYDWHTRYRRKNLTRYASLRAKRRALSKYSVELAGVYEKLYLKTFCHWCGCLLTNKNRTVDHVVPLARGGAHSEENLVACCVSCNSRKNNKFYWEWDGELAA